MEVDPLSALSNALSKLEEVKEGATIQLIIRPTGHQWRKMGRTISHRMQQGKQLKEVSHKTVGHELGKGVGREMSGMFFSAATKKDQPLEKQPVQLTPEEQDLIKAIGEKSAKTGFKVNIRLLASAPTQERADEILSHLENAFSQFENSDFNHFVTKKRIRNKKVIYLHFQEFQ